jgi:hypothetical protein
VTLFGINLCRRELTVGIDRMPVSISRSSRNRIVFRTSAGLSAHPFLNLSYSVLWCVLPLCSVFLCDFFSDVL